MTDQRSAEDVWSRLDELSDDELAMLVEAAEHVIADSADAPDASIYLRMPVTRVGEAIAGSLQDAGTATDPDDVTAVLRDHDSARQLAVQALRTIGEEPALAGQVAAAYLARREMMVVDAGLVAAGALLLLVLKLKRIKIGNVDISFYEARAGALELLRTLLGR
jgi:hypothetical protein